MGSRRDYALFLTYVIAFSFLQYFKYGSFTTAPSAYPSLNMRASCPAFSVYPQLPHNDKPQIRICPSPSPSPLSCRNNLMVNSTENVPVGNLNPDREPCRQNLVLYASTTLSTNSTRWTIPTPSAAPKPTASRICATSVRRLH